MSSTDPTPAPASQARQRARATAERAWRPRTVEEYLDAHWFVYERADRPDPAVRP